MIGETATTLTIGNPIELLKQAESKISLLEDEKAALQADNHRLRLKNRALNTCMHALYQYIHELENDN